ncbi:stage II sporulation protein M [Sporolactobacillus sp. THM19-2]|uniref:stage II sporulation protein M n=1 Tax=Sporolactobacillus sp. THM19-2 TaxID=2511171 RepID=UPI0010201AC7|nr:stage II sporulation protein M [Sporolactobacillus sp. THM19-2]RYL93179.1 stage II sporulation protein M [Sporolactobacillus sp. THM19-2]
MLGEIAGIRIRDIVTGHIRNYLSLYTFVIALFLMGIVFGSIIVNSLPFESRNDLFNYLEQFFGELAKGQIADSHVLFRESLLNDLQYSGLIWVLGLSVIGLPIIFILIFIKGMVLGFTVGFLVGQMGLQGFMAAAVSVFPQNLLMIPVDLFLSVVAVVCSLKMIRQLLMRTRREPLLPQFISYALILLICACFTVIASGYEAYISPTLIGLFVS